VKIVLVTHDSVYGRFFASELNRLAPLDEIIVETGGPSLRFLRRKLLKSGPLDFAFQYLFGRWFERQGQRHLPAREFPPHTRMPDVNRHAFSGDELVIGFGSSYIRRSTLKRLKNGFLNLHTGALPEYRGVKSEFWVIRHGDPEHAGWTLHFMTPRIDEGDIVLRRIVPLTTDDPAELRARILEDAARHVAELVRAVRARGVAALTRRPQGGGRYFSSPTLADWRAWRRARRRPAAPG